MRCIRELLLHVCFVSDQGFELGFGVRRSELTCDLSEALNDPQREGLPPEGVQQSPGIEPALILQTCRASTCQS